MMMMIMMMMMMNCFFCYVWPKKGVHQSSSLPICNTLQAEFESAQNLNLGIPGRGFYLFFVFSFSPLIFFSCLGGWFLLSKFYLNFFVGHSAVSIVSTLNWCEKKTKNSYHSFMWILSEWFSNYFLRIDEKESLKFKKRLN